MRRYLSSVLKDGSRFFRQFPSRETMSGKGKSVFTWANYKQLKGKSEQLVEFPSLLFIHTCGQWADLVLGEVSSQDFRILV